MTLADLKRALEALLNNSDEVITPYGDMTVVDRDNRISISSDTPISEQRDNLSAGVERLLDESVYRIRANDSTETAQTVEQLQYSPGYIGEIGIALRVPEPPTAGQEMRSGYFQPADGITLGWDETDPYVEAIRTDTRQGKLYPGDWNGDVSGERVRELLQNGAITRQQLGLYNYGSVTQQIFGRDDDGRLRLEELHTYSRDSGTTLSRQNNPIRIEAINTTTEDFDVRFADRQATIRGQFTASNRVKGVLQTDINITTSYEPVLTIRIKSDFDTVGVDVLSLQVLSDVDLALQIRSDVGSDTDTDYATPQYLDASETAIEVDTDPSAAVDQGYFRGQRLFSGGGQGNAPTPLGQLETADLEIKTGRPLTLYVRGVESTGRIIGQTTNVEESW